MVAHLMRFHLVLHLEGENSEMGSLLAEAYIFRVLVGQDLLMDKGFRKRENPKSTSY